MSLLSKILRKFGLSKETITIERGSFIIKPGDMEYEYQQLALLKNSSMKDEIMKALILYSRYSELKRQGYDVRIEGEKISGILTERKRIYFDN